MTNVGQLTTIAVCTDPARFTFADVFPGLSYRDCFEILAGIGTQQTLLLITVRTGPSRSARAVVIS